MDRYTQEQVLKGLANHHRVDVLCLLLSSPDLSVEEIANSCTVDYKTMSVHLHKLKRAGLISKNRYGRRVEHRITARGKQAVQYVSKMI